MMLDEEREVRAALHRALDVPAPPVRADVGSVIERGRRRVLLHRAGALGGVAVVVAGVAAGAFWLRSAIPGGPGAGQGGYGQVEVGAPPTAGSSGRTTGAAPALPGWTTVLAAPPGTGQDPTAGGGNTAGKEALCMARQLDKMEPVPGTLLLPEETVVTAFTRALKETPAAATLRAVKSSGWDVKDRLGMVEAGIGEGLRSAALSLDAGVYAGPPERGAYFALYSGGGCSALRTTLPNGAIVLLFPSQQMAKGQAQRVVAFTPAGRRYDLLMLTVGVGAPSSTTWGENAAPLSEAELAGIGVRLAELG